MATIQYRGARYVPKFATPTEWDVNTAYEPLTIVTYRGDSYTSKRAVPAGTDLRDEEFWAATGNYNAQIEHYQDIVYTFDDRISEAEDANRANAAEIAKETQDRIASVNKETQDRIAAIAAEERARIAEDGNLAGEIAKETQDRIAAVNKETQDRIAAIAAEERSRIAEDGNLTAEINNLAGDIASVRAKLDSMGIRNVKDYGAVGDGTTDDTQAINDALAAGGRIYIPRGRYKITSQLKVGSNTIVTGDQATLLASGSGSGIDIVASDSAPISNVIIEGLELYSPSKSADNGIYVGQATSVRTNLTNINIDKCWIHNFRGGGIHTHGATSGEGTYTHGHPEISISNTKCEQNAVGIVNSGTSPIIVGCICISNDLEGITLDNGCVAPIVIGCKISNNRGGVGGIGVDECAQPIIANCYIQDNAGSGQIRYQCNTGRVDNGSITGCTIVAKNNAAISIGNDATKLGASAAITGCTETNATKAIELFEGDGSQLALAGNLFNNPGDDNHITYINNHLIAKHYNAV